MNEDDVGKMLSGLSRGLSQFIPADITQLDHDIETESGGGLVKVVFDKNGAVSKLVVDPLLLDKENVGHLEQLVIAAVNDGLSKWHEALKQKGISTLMRDLPEGIDIQKAMADALKGLNR